MYVRRMLAASGLLAAAGAVLVAATPAAGALSLPVPLPTAAKGAHAHHHALGSRVLPSSVPVNVSVGPVSVHATVPATVKGLLGGVSSAGHVGSGSSRKAPAPGGRTSTASGGRQAPPAGSATSGPAQAPDRRGIAAGSGSAPAAVPPAAGSRSSASPSAALPTAAEVANDGALVRAAGARHNAPRSTHAKPARHGVLSLSRALLPHPGPALYIALVVVCAGAVGLVVLAGGRRNGRGQPLRARVLAKRR